MVRDLNTRDIIARAGKDFALAKAVAAATVLSPPRLVARSPKWAQ
jgi:hypothetical protein